MTARRSLAICAVVILICSSAARAATDPLVARLPADGNLLLAVDAVQFLQSPLAAYQGWPNTDPTKFPRTPNPLPETAGLQRVLVTEQIDTRTGQPLWKAAVLQLNRDVDLNTVAASRGGYMDSIGDRPVAVVRGDLFFIDLGSHMLGATSPADRRFTAQWLRQSGSISNYLQSAAAQTGAGAPVVLAMDLADTISEAAARRTLQQDTPDSAAGSDLAAVAKVLSGLRGFVVKIALGDATSNQQASAQALIEFTGDAAPLAPVAKELVLQVMSDRGLSIPDVQQWDFTASGNTIAASGPLSVDSLRRILTIAHAPSPTGSVSPVASNNNDGDAKLANAVAAPGQGQDPSSPAAKAAASQKYYKTVSMMLNDMRPGPSLKDSAGYLGSDARRIEQLPILNVDPDLVNWGSYVASAFRDAASIFASGQQRVTAQVNGISQPYYTYNDSSSSVNELQAASDSRNVSNQRRQAAANEKAQVINAVSKPLQDAIDSQSKIRLQMVQRYNVEF